MKDMKKASRLEPFLPHLQEADAFLEARKETGLEEQVRYFKKLVEEYRVSLFAPELGTAIPVSPKRLIGAWKKISPLL
jgi:ATP-dependent helicase HrpA